ncbi:family 20 glycosylhydrolase [Allobaculum sp. Allo2]|uniref:family 20 glycosylhydrolase n=1 Tax=Allobaculum sp. Allo2 TaxID=2853432 RepID=UPI003462D0C0
MTAKDVFYTKEEFADYIEECKKMGITIVPEFDMPAHALAMTKVRPDLKTPDSDMPHVTTNGNRSPADHLDLNHQYDDVMQFVKSIWDEYTTGDDKVFDTPVIHIGADEYEAGSAAYRKYVNDMFKYAEDKGYTPRVWGSLTQLSQGIRYMARPITKMEPLNPVARSTSGTLDGPIQKLCTIWAST